MSRTSIELTPIEAAHSSSKADSTAYLRLVQDVVRANLLPRPEWHSFSLYLPAALGPIGADSLFTVANLFITSVFPAKTQALAGGVFNPVSQMGKSVGLAIVAVIAQSVAANEQHGEESPEGLLHGYRATFWFCFGLVGMTTLVGVWGSRNIGLVGHKRD